MFLSTLIEGKGGKRRLPMRHLCHCILGRLDVSLLALTILLASLVTTMPQQERGVGGDSFISLIIPWVTWHTFSCFPPFALVANLRCKESCRQEASAVEYVIESCSSMSLDVPVAALL